MRRGRLAQSFQLFVLTLPLSLTWPDRGSVEVNDSLYLRLLFRAFGHSDSTDVRVGFSSPAGVDVKIIVPAELTLQNLAIPNCREEEEESSATALAEFRMALLSLPLLLLFFLLLLL